MSLMNGGDIEKRVKIYEKIKLFGPLVSALAYIGGIVYFLLLPHESLIHRTYLSENALLPGLVSSDIFSTDMLLHYHDLLKTHIESQESKQFNVEFINDLFVKQAHMESYIQHFNVTNPFPTHSNIQRVRPGKNVYAFGRAYRTDGTESIIVSAPLYISKPNGKVPNLLGIAELFVMAELARSRPYWAKDLIFLISDQGYSGAQAWINSYFDIKSDYIEAENLKKRCGSIQAAINLELEDLNLDNLELKLEGVNGKLPNLDLFNTIIKICRNIQFKCALHGEMSPSMFQETYYQQRPPVNYLAGVHNTIAMVFRQATGVPTSSHGFFMEQRIEALTISGGKPERIHRNKKHFKQNILKLTRVIESTLRSINNLLERFHQSFFFYLLASSSHYISIGMYMPAFGLVCLPLLIQMIKIWCSIFFDKPSADTPNSPLTKPNVLGFLLPKFTVSIGFGLMLQLGTPLFIYYGTKFNLEPEYSLLYSYVTIFAYILGAPFLTKKLKLKSEKLINNTELSRNILCFLTMLALVMFMGTLSLLNFSLAFLIALIYVPITLLAIQTIDNELIKLGQLVVIALAAPLIYFTLLFLIYMTVFDNLDTPAGFAQLISVIARKLYDLTLMSKLSHVWTLNLVNICLTPIWSLIWFIAFPKI